MRQCIVHHVRQYAGLTGLRDRLRGRSGSDCPSRGDGCGDIWGRRRTSLNTRVVGDEQERIAQDHRQLRVQDPVGHGRLKRCPWRIQMLQDAMGTCGGSYSRQIPRRMGRVDRPLRRLLDSSTSIRSISPRCPVPGRPFCMLLKITRTVCSHTRCHSLNRECISQYLAMNARGGSTNARSQKSRQRVHTMGEMKSALREVRSPSKNPVAHRADRWT